MGLVLPAGYLKKIIKQQDYLIYMFPSFDESSVDKIKGIKIPKVMSLLLAEDVGFHVGDGHMKIEDNGWGTKYRFSYSGDSRYDKDYFQNVLIPRKKELFNISTDFREFKNVNAIEVRFSSKKLVLFYKFLGIPDGKKTNVNIPERILGGSLEIKKAFLRGLADSDFGLSLKNRPNGIYPVLGFASISELLRDQVNSLLKKKGFNTTAYIKTYYDLRVKKQLTTFAFDLNGKTQLEKWMDKIGFSNKKHLNRYNKWARADSNR